MSSNESQSAGASRRDILSGAPLLAAAAVTAVSAAAPSEAEAQAAPAAALRPGLGGGAQGQIFWTVETTAGKVQGMQNTGIKEF